MQSCQTHADRETELVEQREEKDASQFHKGPRPLQKGLTDPEVVIAVKKSDTVQYSEQNSGRLRHPCQQPSSRK